MTQLFQRRWIRLFVFVAAAFSLPTLATKVWADDFSPDDNPVPELTIQTLSDVALGNGDLADVHFPNIPSQLRDAFTDTFPIVVLLQGANVDKAQYKPFARRLARRGFVVVVPNHFIPGTPTLFTSRTVITNALTQLGIENATSTSPLHKIVATNRVGLVGHSFGGVVGLFASQPSDSDFCVLAPPFLAPFLTPLCQGPYTRPIEFTAAVFYGTNLVIPGSPNSPPPPPPFDLINLNTSGVAVALIQGTKDGIAPLQNAQRTYPTLEQARALITLNGANHYGICKDNNPIGATLDPNWPTLAQSEAIAVSAKWTALWLRAQLKSDALAKFKIYGLAASDDDEVAVQTN